MKNKYEKCYYENEGKNLKIEKIKAKLLKLKYYIHVLNKSGFNDFKVVAGSNINCIAITLSMMNDYWQNWIVKNVINCVNRETLVLTYINQLNSLLAIHDYDKIDTVMKSFKKSRLIKDIKLNDNKKIFELLTLDDSLIKFTSQFWNKEEVERANSYCHKITEEACMKLDDIYATTVIMKNYFGNSYYHSFVVKDGIVHDFAQNIVMSFDNYKKLFGCKVIMNVEGKQLLKNIEFLKKHDIEFKENRSYDILKYAMHKQIKKERNMVRH